MTPPGGQAGAEPPGADGRLRRRPMARRIDIARYLPYHLTVLANALSSSASREYLHEFGIGVNDWRVVSHLGVDPGCTAQTISNVLQVDKSVVSRSVSTLVERGLVAVESTPGFRRLYLTGRGAALHKRMVPVALEREQRLLAGLDAEEVDTLLALLRRLHANLPAVTERRPGGRARQGGDHGDRGGAALAGG